MADKESTIQMLAADMRDEHAAIVQYLQHAYALGESGEACEIEAIARDEMRHFDWLAEKVVELGGSPDLERGYLDLSGNGPLDWIANDIQAENRAIAQYEAHIAAIDDPTIKRLLRRIVADERAHKGDFSAVAEELAEEGVEASGPLESRTPTDVPTEVVDAIQKGVKHEYSVILQYLYHNYVMPQCEVGDELEMQAINEMQHLGWLAEELAERDGYPVIERGQLVLDGSPADLIQADIDVEREVTAVYESQIGQIEDEEITELLERIRDNEIYHEAVFEDLLEEVHEADVEVQEQQTTATAADKPSFTVGSLID